ncbi:MAG: hypothetical protein Ct9H300mP17_14840 [Candidatus Nitrosopelagicus sp.]|nr:MAG: hypothetical protein Ct9H300mP17_14840 [Candidatus Nitrosopelagicus sp.]
MSAAVTHGKMMGAKKIICASTGNTSASAGMFAANEKWNVMFTFQMDK